MFYGNSDLLEKTLHNDLNTLIKNVKAREDQHLTLLQYNKGLIEQLSQMDSIPFFQQELAKYRSFLDSMKTSDVKVKKQQDQMLEKYSCVSSGQSSIIKLMGRVTARVIQILQASLEKAKSLDDKLQKRYLTLKNNLLELVESKDKVDIQGFLEAIIFHVQLKSKEEISQLQKIINILVSGNFSQLGHVYQPVKKQVLPPPQQKVVNPTPSLQKREFKKHSLERSRQKFDKMREQAKQIEKLKKKKEKLAIRMLTTLYNPMQLSKNQFMEDMVFTNREYKQKQLYEQVFSRNKFNYAQIMEFESRKDRFEMKVKAFKEKMEKQSKKIQQALVFINHNFISTVSETNAYRFKEPLTPVPARLSQKKENLEYTSSRKQTKSEADEEDFDVDESKIMEKELIFRKREYRFLSKAPTPKSVKAKQGLYASMQSTQEGFHYKKLNIQNQQQSSRSSNKAKLPQIPGRSSLDYRYEQKKRPQPQKRINIAKNVEIGNIINPQLKPLNPQHNLRSGRKSPRERHTPSTNIGFQYIFYVNKKSNKVQQETKNNFLF